MLSLGLDPRPTGLGRSEEHPTAGSWVTSANPFLLPSPSPLDLQCAEQIPVSTNSMMFIGLLDP